MNCAYWDRRFPRVLSSAEHAALQASGEQPLLIGDLGCDVGGSVQDLVRTTSIEAPFFRFDAAAEGQDSRCFDDMDGGGTIFSACDILPSELPKEASAHFGSLLLPFIEPLCTAAAEPEPRAAAELLPSPLQGALITNGGALTERFGYIAQMRAEIERRDAQERKIKKVPTSVRGLGAVSDGGVASTSEWVLPGDAVTTTFRLTGQLFDSNALSQALDLLEENGLHFRMSSCDVGPNFAGDLQPQAEPDEDLKATGLVKDGRSRGALHRLELSSMQSFRETTADIEVGAKSEAVLAATCSALEQLLHGIEGADATVVEVHEVLRTFADTQSQATTTVDLAPAAPTSTSGSASANDKIRLQPPDSAQRVLLLGAGLVAGPCLSHLTRAGSSTFVTVVSSAANEAAALVEAHAPPAAARGLHLDPLADLDKLERLVSGSDVVISLLPVHMDPCCCFLISNSLLLIP